MPIGLLGPVVFFAGGIKRRFSSGMDMLVTRLGTTPGPL